MSKKGEDLSELHSISSDIFNTALVLISSFAYIYILNLKRKNILSSKNQTYFDKYLKNIDIIELIIAIKIILDDNYFICIKEKQSVDDYLEYIASLFEIVSIIIQLKVFLMPSEDILLEFPID